MSQLSDATLADLTTAGHRPAAAELYRRHVGAVAAVCRKRGPAGEADDLVQETFAALLARGRPLQDPGAVLRWLLATASNIAIAEIRAHRNSRTHHVGDGDPPLAPITHEDDTIDRVVVRQLLADFADDRDADLIGEHLIGEVPLRAIAARADASYGAIKVRIHRARKRLASLADAKGVRAVIPFGFLRLADRLPRLQRADVVATGILLPLAIVAGAAATTIGSHPDTVEGATPRQQQAAHVAERTSSLPGANLTRHDALPTPGPPTPAPPGSVREPARAPSRTLAVRPALVAAEPVEMPAGAGRVATAPQTPADYEIGADTGTTVSGVRLGVTVSIHDEPTLEPAAATACDAATATPATYCND